MRRFHVQGSLPRLRASPFSGAQDGHERPLPGLAALLAGRARLSPRTASRYVLARMIYAIVACSGSCSASACSSSPCAAGRAARARRCTPNRGSASALVTVGVVLLFAFGLVVPALVLAFNGEHKASVAVGGLHLNAERAEGPRTVRPHVRRLPHARGRQVRRPHRPEPRHPRGRRDLHAGRAQGARAERDRRRPRPRARPDARAALPGQGSRRRRRIRRRRRRSLSRSRDRPDRAVFWPAVDSDRREHRTKVRRDGRASRQTRPRTSRRSSPSATSASSASGSRTSSVS